MRPMTDLGYSLGSNQQRFNNINANFLISHYQLELKNTINNKPIVFEGSTEDNFETVFTLVDPTADRTITLPDATGTVALTSQLYTDSDVNTFLAGGTAGNIVTTGYIAGPASFTIDPAAVGDNTGTVIIAGNLQVDGTTTTINSTTLDVDDLNITVASGAPTLVPQWCWSNS